jgi:hypothetical protein
MADEQDRIARGFAELSARLEAGADAETTAKQKAEANRVALEQAQARVRREYAAFGVAPPSPLALSITARKAMGMPLPDASFEDEKINMGGAR